MKKLLLPILILIAWVPAVAQEKSTRDSKRESRRNKINEMVKQEEEGVLVYHKQNIFAIQLRSNGFGGFYELGRSKTPNVSMLYSIEFNETKHQKEDKKFVFFGNPYIYGKINNFYNLKLGVGQQRVLGQKGNKNGIAVMGVYSGGLSVGLLRPYYIRYNNGGFIETIKYSPADSAKFVDGPIDGAAGIGKGWGEMKIKPGAFAKAAIRFDWGRFNETVSGLEAGISAEFYAGKVPLMLFQKENQFFFQGHLAILFGRRK
ncbi:MAG: hypothetical protein JNN29_07595 [Chitinophagaceae bacterium]|nr:hypothetical protein [Chitinophagaceae bacterium]MBN8667837.1 hypothetical protein [Chitinophagales bacterium]